MVRTVMPIYIDPTEGRERTRLPGTVLRQAKVLLGFERITGADLLVTLEQAPVDVRDMDVPETTDIKAMAWHGCSPQEIVESVGKPLPFVLKVLKFRQACRSGLLVQRKSGRDLASSVPRLSEILVKMLDWTDKPWLLFVGQLWSDRRGECIIDGQKTGFSHNAVQGALESWQLRGGFVTCLSRDGLVAPWLARWHDKLGTLGEAKLTPVRAVQPVVGPKSENAWMTTLASLPHVGSKKARVLAEHYGTLAGCIEALTDPALPAMEGRPEGVGAVTVRENRVWFGLDEQWLRLRVVGEER